MCNRHYHGHYAQEEEDSAWRTTSGRCLPPSTALRQGPAPQYSRHMEASYDDTCLPTNWSLKASLKMTSGAPGRSGTPYDLSNRFHSQGLAAGGSALLDAINRGKVHLAKFILDAGEQDVVNTRDFKGKTPLIRACYIKEEKTRAKAIDLLLSKGADVNIQDDSGRTALSYACELRCNDVVRVLVKNNVDPDIADDMGNTPLIHSAMVGNDTGVEILIRSFRRLGLNVDHVNNEGLTALLIASKHGFIECASILALEGKACISFRDREKGMNAEEWARAQGCLTPEILPFSSQAAFLNYKLPRDDLDLEDDDPGPGRQEAAAGAGADGRKMSSTSRARYSVSPPSMSNKPRLSKTNKDLDMDELNKKLSQLHARTGDGGGGASKGSSRLQVLEYGNRARDKRSSLPSIKFFGMFWNNDSETVNNREDVALPSIDKSGKGGQQALTPEGTRKHRRKSASKRGQQADADGSTALPPPSPSSGMRYDYSESSSRRQSADQRSLSPRSPKSPKSPRSPKSTEVSPKGSLQMVKPESNARSPTLTSASSVQVTFESNSRVSPEPLTDKEKSHPPTEKKKV